LVKPPIPLLFDVPRPAPHTDPPVSLCFPPPKEGSWRFLQTNSLLLESPEILAPSHLRIYAKMGFSLTLLKNKAFPLSWSPFLSHFCLSTPTIFSFPDALPSSTPSVGLLSEIDSSTYWSPGPSLRPLLAPPFFCYWRPSIFLSRRFSLGAVPQALGASGFFRDAVLVSPCKFARRERSKNPAQPSLL